MTQTSTVSASDAIAILIELAQQGEIDPWDVQVIDVIDRFLDELGVTQDRDLAYQQTNLPKSGQAFLWASMLVRFKADTLEETQTSEETLEILDPEEITDELDLGSGRLKLEQRLRRRSAATPPRQRRVTLQELIAHIQEIAEELEKVTPSRRRRSGSRPQSHREAIEIVTQLAHQENLTELAEQLEKFFEKHLSQYPHSQKELELEELLIHWHQNNTPEPSQVKHDRVGVFWALLLLSSQSKVELSQEEFYQDLKIQFLESP